MTAVTSASQRVRIRDVVAFQQPVRLRMPFHLGNIMLDRLATVHVRVELELGGERLVGVGASMLSPLWFDKSPDRDLATKTQALLTSVSLAADGYRETGSATPWDLHRAVQPAVTTACHELEVPALASSFGVAIIDSAIIDALCRRHAMSLHSALRSDMFGFGEVPQLPASPRAHLPIRHTIGLADPLTSADVTEPLDDGLPETLDDIVRAYGVRYFKIKIGADSDANLNRLASIQRVLDRVAAPEYRVVLDGNEAYPALDGFVAFLERLASDPTVRLLYDRLLWIEQPVGREVALAEGGAADVRLASSFRPLILDESDATDETVDRAVRAGYAGVSAKNCKGVFRTLHASRVLAGRPGAILSAEDLTLAPLAPLHQDTAVISALGLPHAERNGHHFVRGLSGLPAAEQQRALREYPSLYETGADGLVKLCIRDGAIDISDLVGVPYGMVSSPDLTHMSPLPLPDDTL